MKPEILSPPTKTEKSLAHETHAKILTIIKEIKAEEASLDKNYVSLGRNVYVMQNKQLWQELNYNSWKDYFGFLQEKFGVGRTQLIGYTSTVRALSDHVSDEQMVQMGISKAGELKKAVVATSKSPSDELLAKAVDKKVTLPEFREAVHKEFHITDHSVKGSWYELGGVYFTQEERAEFEKAVKLTKSIDPVIDHTLAKHVQFKEVLFRWIAEFTDTYLHHSQESIDGFNDIFGEVNHQEM